MAEIYGTNLSGTILPKTLFDRTDLCLADKITLQRAGNVTFDFVCRMLSDNGYNQKSIGDILLSSGGRINFATIEVPPKFQAIINSFVGNINESLLNIGSLEECNEGDLFDQFLALMTNGNIERSIRLEFENKMTTFIENVFSCSEVLDSQPYENTIFSAFPIYLMKRGFENEDAFDRLTMIACKSLVEANKLIAESDDNLDISQERVYQAEKTSHLSELLLNGIFLSPSVRQENFKHLSLAYETAKEIGNRSCNLLAELLAANSPLPSVDVIDAQIKRLRNPLSNLCFHNGCFAAKLLWLTCNKADMSSRASELIELSRARLERIDSVEQVILELVGYNRMAEIMPTSNIRREKNNEFELTTRNEINPMFRVVYDYICENISNPAKRTNHFGLIIQSMISKNLLPDVELENIINMTAQHLPGEVIEMVRSLPRHVPGYKIVCDKVFDRILIDVPSDDLFCEGARKFFSFGVMKDDNRILDIANKLTEQVKNNELLAAASNPQLLGAMDIAIAFLWRNYVGDIANAVRGTPDAAIVNAFFKSYATASSLDGFVFSTACAIDNVSFCRAINRCGEISAELLDDLLLINKDVYLTGQSRRLEIKADSLNATVSDALSSATVCSRKM